ncbi:hypothetical protein PENSPDRAFT_606685 [Peniophora sp. CONT]|nr:hypothetical protein PENSPDRAFT_606685 [Peniophora sp. CONT]
MPFTRPRTKSQSNGVAPNFPAPNAPRFFPPSHFAASGNLRSPTRAEDPPSFSNRAIIPASTLPHLPASPSVSSADAAAASSRLGQLTRKLSLTRNGPSGASSSTPKVPSKRQANKNEHWKGEVPELEANLLPSLRDTIDRMTHPPSPNPGGRPRQVPASSAPGYSAAARYPAQPAQTSPQRTFPQRDGSRLPTPKSGRLPIPALKSALKTPTAPSTVTSPHRSPAKTTRFGNGPGANARGPSSIPLRQATSAPSSEFSEHRRHRTDPGSDTLPAGSRIPARVPKTPQPPSRAPPLHASGPSTDISSSSWEWGLAPRQRLVVANATVEASSSESDHDAYHHGYPRQQHPPQPEYTRMLHKQRVSDDRDSPTPHARQRTEPRRSVGLGLNVRVPERDVRGYQDSGEDSEAERYEVQRSAQHEADMRHAAREYREPELRRHLEANTGGHDAGMDDAESVYEDSDIEPDPPPSTPRRDANTRNSRHGTHTAPRSALVGSPLTRSRTASPYDDRRRERALSGIVDVLEREATFERLRREDAAGLSQEESDEGSSEYGGQPGFAVSDADMLDERRRGDVRVRGNGRESVALEDGDEYYQRDHAPSYLEELSAETTPTQHYPSSHNPSASQRASRVSAASPRPAAPRRRASSTSIQPESRSDPTTFSPPSTSQHEPALRRWPPPPTHPRNSVAPPKIERSETYNFHDRIRREEAASKAAFGIADSPPPNIRPTESATTIGSDRWDEQDHAEGLSIGVESIFGQMDERASSPEARSPRSQGRYRQGDSARSPIHPDRTERRRPAWAEVREDDTRRSWLDEDSERSAYSQQYEDTRRSARAPSPPILPPRQAASHSRHTSRASSPYHEPPQSLNTQRSVQFSSSVPSRSHNRTRANSMPSNPSLASLTASESVQSLYTDGASDTNDGPGTPTVLPLDDATTWRETLSSAEFTSLLDRYGEMEVERQEAIWALHSSEQTFVSTCQRAIRLFIQPLRAQDSRVWLPGMPPSIARLLDWFEDIAYAHAQLVAALHAARTAQYPVVLRAAETLRAAIPRLEVHQPYLVRVEEVVRDIQTMRVDRRSDFGEFVRLQERTDDARGWPLDRFLLEPVSRLEGYGQRFRRLWELTPRDHSDHLSTFALLHSTELMVRVMFEVRARENEYDLVNDILSQIEGLPASLGLASRERRLLARGRLLRQHYGSTGPDTAARPKSHAFGSALMRARMAEQQNRPFDDTLQTRSHREGSSYSTDSSVLSPASPFTATSSSLPDTPATTDDFDVPDIHSPHDDRYTRPRSTLLHLRAQAPSKQSTLHVFAFTDLVLLCSTIRPVDAQSTQIWRLLDDIGISRVLGVKREGGALVLDLLPIDADDLKSGVDPETAPVAAATLTVPTTSTSGVPLDVEDATARWASAFDVCAQHTLRALALPAWLAQRVDSHSDAHSMMAILSSGLPLPKSPSVQLSDIGRGRGGDTVQQEREERGWWSLRFQSVLRETLGRQDAASPGPFGPSFALGELASKEASGPRRPGVLPHGDSRLLRQ